jgi:hypothetical protein
MKTMSPADIARAVFNDYDMGALEKAYLHRAMRRRGGLVLRGRAAIRQDYLEDLTHFVDAPLTIDADLPRFAGFHWDRPDGGKSRRHQWVSYEGRWIARETCIDDNSPRPAKPLFHAPLGELQSGRGQLGAGEMAAFGPVAAALHQLWNGRSLDIVDQLYDVHAIWQGPVNATNQYGNSRAGLKKWLLAMFLDYPQSYVTFADTVEQDNQIALLWQWSRIHVSGQRDRVCASTWLELKDGLIVRDETVIDG